MNQIFFPALPVVVVNKQFQLYLKQISELKTTLDLQDTPKADLVINGHNGGLFSVNVFRAKKSKHRAGMALILDEV